MNALNENKKKKRFFIKGLVFALPVFLTSWILYKIVVFMSSVIPDFVILNIIEIYEKLSDTLVSENTSSLIGIILGFILTIVIIYSLGIAISITGKKFFEKIEQSFLFKIPIFSTIYKTIKQIVESVSNPDKNSFKKVVMVEFPRTGVCTLGFVTGESKSKNQLEYYHVIVPTTPNPTSAFLLFIPKNEVKETDLSIDEGIKTIISGGVLTSSQNQI